MQAIYGIVRGETGSSSEEQAELIRWIVGRPELPIMDISWQSNAEVISILKNIKREGCRAIILEHQDRLSGLTYRQSTVIKAVKRLHFAMYCVSPLANGIQFMDLDIMTGEKAWVDREEIPLKMNDLEWLSGVASKGEITTGDIEAYLLDFYHWLRNQPDRVETKAIIDRIGKAIVLTQLTTRAAYEKRNTT